jgi:hypothetical protein
VASRALKGVLLAGTALAAATAVAVLALSARRPEPELSQFAAAGPMLEIPVERVTEVEVRAGNRHWRFERAGGHWRAGAGTPSPGFEGHIDAGLRFLHASAPEARLPAAQLERAFFAEAGLDPPRYVVSARTDDARTLTVAFGTPNPRGLAQYARVGEERDILLLPRYVGEAWEAATGLR